MKRKFLLDLILGFITKAWRCIPSCCLWWFCSKIISYKLCNLFEFSIHLTFQITEIWFALAEEGPHKEVRVKWARLSGVLRMNTVENATAIPRPPTTKSQQNGHMNKAPEYYIIFTGFNLDEQALRDWLKTCCKPVCCIRSRFLGLSTSLNDPGH